jgi:DNA polymerase-3 subunit alpha
MEEQLKETYGVMIYQEDVLKVCHYFGGLDLADADVLRRMMSGKGKKKKELEVIVQKFFSNCKEKGYPDELTKEVWRQIESFAGYSFSKAHSASYAMESFQSLYLKAHYPLEFMVAVINNFGGFYSVRVYVNEARRAGATINLPCVNKGLYTTTIYGKDIYLGFIHIQNLKAHFAKLIPEERERNGDYLNLENFIARTAISLEQLILLIRVNAFRFTGKTKKELLWEAHLLLNNVVKPMPDSLFESPKKEYKLPAFEFDVFEDAYDEMELIGFPVTVPDFNLLKTNFRGEIQAPELISHVGKTVKMLGSYVTTKPVRTKHGHLMCFGTFLDSEGNFFDTTHFPQSLKHSPMRGNGLYLILGKVVEEFGFPSLEVEKMAKLPIYADPRAV